MAAVSLRSICKDLGSPLVKSRQAAFTDLQRFLSHEDASSRLVDENTYVGLLQMLLHNFGLELAGFRKSNSAVAGKLLHLSAECLRVSVEKAAHLITRKTMRTVVQHVLDCLPTLQQAERNEVAPSYFALLKNITSNPIHVEQMGEPIWKDLLQLCISSIEVSKWFDISRNHANHEDDISGNSQAFVESRSTLPMRKEVIDLLLCLQSLCAFPGAPFQGEHEEERLLLTFLLNFLATYDSASDARMSAIITLNRLLAHIACNNVELAAQTSIALVELVSRVWDTRIPGFKDRLLISISLLYPHLHKTATSEGLSSTTRKHIQTLLEKLSRDSRAHEQKSGLKLDDLVLSTLPRSSPLWIQRPFQSFIGPSFSLNPESTSAELPWLVLQIQSSFVTLLDLALSRGSDGSNGDHQSKRRRLASDPHFMDLLDSIIQYNQGVRSVVVFQRIAFYLNSFRPLPESVDFSELLVHLERVGDADNGEVVGWSFVCMLAILGRLGKIHNTPVIAEQWKRIWIACSKQAALSVPCRPACALMKAIMDTDILDARSLVPQIETFAEYIEQRGPGVFCDNSCEFWSSLLYKFEEIGVPTDIWRAQTLVRWVRFRWDASERADPVVRRRRLVSLGLPILRLFSSVLWNSANVVDFAYLESLPQSSIRQTLNSSSSAMSLLNYLLESAIEPARQSHESMSPSSRSNVAHHVDLNDILEEKCGEVDRLLNSTQEIRTADELAWYILLCMISMLLRGPQARHESLKTIADSISAYSGNENHVELCLRTISQFMCLADFRFRKDQRMEMSLQQRVQDIYADPIFREVVGRLCDSSRKFVTGDHTEDDEAVFRGSQATITSSALSLDNNWAMRDMSRSDMTQNGWEMRTLVRLHTEVHLFNNLTTSVISQEYFRTVSTQNLLLAGDQVSRTIFEVGDAISQSATEKLLRSFKADIASTYNWGGNEMTVRLAMAIISPYFALRERIDRDSSIHNLVMQLHRWVLKVVINRKLSSSKARIKVAMLLLVVSRFDLGYGKEADENSTAGMRLIQLIKDPDARVKFVLGSHIDCIFLLFPPSARVEVYRDMVESLEGNESQSEGFALRAYTLMHLALASDDIRRAAMVNLLELGKFSSCMFTVQACFVHLADRLYGGQIAELFLQNSSQFIFSWIDFQEDIFQFPFHCFGFPDFKSWTLSVKEELVAQLVNANKWEDAAKLFRANSPFDEILLDCLPRIVSYSHLMQTGVSDGPSAAEQCEAAVGKDIYIATLTGQFARSVAIMIERFDDRTLSSESFNSIGLGEAPHILSNTQLSPLGPSHPEPPQPSYDLRKVSAAIEYLRQELNIPPQGVWSPANTTFVIRQLVTLGVGTSDSTVALSFLRRIVLVFCLAGKSIIDGYTLEMLLFSLKEFIGRETMCQDTLDVIKYIFSRGSVHFDKNPEILRDAIAVILPPVQTLLFAIPDQQKKGIIDIYVFLERLMLSLSSPPTCLRATAQMLAMLQKVPLSEDASVGQIIDAVISENQRLWGEERLCYFALSLLSGDSNVFFEPLSTLRRLVLHFLKSDHFDEYAADSKIWLGLAIGRVSMDPSFTHPEHHSMDTRIQTTDDLVKSRNAIICETINFMRSDPSIAGLLEQALRHMISCSPGKRLPDLGTQQYLAEYLWSPHIDANVNLLHFKQLPPPSALEKWGLFDGPFVKWHKDLACSIAQHLPGQLYATLIPSINASKAFCDTIFPFLIDEYRSQDGYDGSISKIFNAVLEAADSTDLDYSRLVIRTILILRKQPGLPSKGAHQLLLDEVNYLHAATAAVACKMFKTALMFLEIHWNPNKLPPERLSDQTLFSVYGHIDDPDLTHALSQSINRSWARLLDVYKLHHDRDGINGLRQARLRSKVELGVNPSVNDDDLRAVADSVRQNGFPLRSTGISFGTSPEVQEDTSSLYKTAWRLGTWDLPPLTTSKDSDTLLYAVLYHLVQPKLADEFSNVLDSSIVRVVDRISDGLSATERSKTYLCLSMFANVKALFSNLQPLTTAARRWALQIKEKAQYRSYEELEPQASLHNAIFNISERHVHVRKLLQASNGDFDTLLAESFLAFCEMTRLCGDSNDLLLALAKTGFLEQKFERNKQFADVYPAILAERAEILWRRRETTEAVQALRSLVAGSSIMGPLSFTLIPKEMVLAKLASWTSQMRLRSSDSIMQELLDPAAESLGRRSITTSATAGKVSFEYAMFCTTQLEDQHTIADIKRMENLYKTKQAEVSRYEVALQDARQMSDKALVTKLAKDREKAIKLRNMDRAELQRLHRMQHVLLEKAIENFLRCFSACSDFDQHVPKFCAIWLKHSKQESLQSIVVRFLGSVPSYKFLPLLHQLCSRLSRGSDDFQTSLSDLIARICMDHPFHSLHQILSTVSSIGEKGDLVAESRSFAATRLKDHLSRTPKLQDLVARINVMFSAYSELASIPTQKTDRRVNNEIALSSYPTLRRFRKLLQDLRLPPPSLDLPVSPDGNYSSVPYVQQYHHSFEVAGGVNQPKILKSMLSDGKNVRELVKGNDDLHQDAIMQQIFQQMDGVMKRNRETRRRGMRIRTYKVVPLRPNTGVIEWVLETIPLLEYLDKTHHSVNRNDWKWSVCRTKISDATSLDYMQRLKVYQDVCVHFNPVLRHFFFEFFRDPDSWFSRRINYSRSVAASSMIGHVLGLGDRHGQNILLDKRSGEVVHIDLGVAFEQGTMLPVPETVPFRLTRDMVDGFGISGCEGTFMRASTFALTVFRDEEDTISTFLDVLKYDPLYNWTISPLKAWTLQRDMHGETTDGSKKRHNSLPEAEADRAIQVVKRKLSSQLSAEADVRQLIFEATDEGNLSRMYCGKTSPVTPLILKDGRHLHEPRMVGGDIRVEDYS